MRKKQELKKLQSEIEALVDKFYKLVNPSKAEVRDSIEMMTEDPYNQIHDFLDLDLNTVSAQYNIALEVLDERELKAEDKRNENRR